MTLHSQETILVDVEAKAHTIEGPGEDDLSINDWIGRIQGVAKTAHAAARMGEDETQYDAFVEMAVIAVRRAFQLREHIDSENDAEAQEEAKLEAELKRDGGA